MRNLRAIAAAILLIVAVVPQSASAETGPARSEVEFDRVNVDFSFTEGGRDFTGQLLIQRDTTTGASTTSFFFFSGVIVTCDNGTPDDPTDDFERQDLIDFTSNEVSPSSLLIDDKLRFVTASGVGTGERIHLEACTDVQTSTTETVPWSVELTGSGSVAHFTQVERFPNEDGTVTMQTIKIADRPATGSIDVGEISLTTDSASITHTLIVETTH